MENMPPLPPINDSYEPAAATTRPAPEQKPVRLGLKILFIALITLGLMIPDLIIYSVSDDRQDNRDTAVNSIASSWSGPQLVSGPILTIPYSYRQDNQRVSGTLRILPANLEANATLDSRTLSRSIYETSVYSGPVQLSGSFSLAELSATNIPFSALDLDKATVTVGVGDLKGLESVSQLDLGRARLTMNGTTDSDVYSRKSWSSRDQVFVISDTDDFTDRPDYNRSYRYNNDSYNGCLQAPVNLLGIADSTYTDIPFSVSMHLKGSQSFGITPVGRQNLITIDGTCASPSFGGMFLPSDRTVKDGQFKAIWNLNSNNRDYPQAFTDNKSTEISDSAVAVNMLIPVDGYQKVDRSLKYAFVVIILTFITVLFCELISKTSIHMFQYLLIGLALILFYSLLLSLVEHMSFGLSYIIAGVLTISMVTLYVYGVIKSKRMALLTGSVLSLMYIFIYILMCLETYALLTGSIGLFLALATVMYISLRLRVVYTD